MTDASHHAPLQLTDLAETCARLRSQGRRVVLCHGCFDFLHFGHLRHFKAARAFGDVLCVTVTPDRFIDKGEGRPVFPEAYRLEFVAALAPVDFAALNQWPSAIETIRLLKPHRYIKGGDYRNYDPNHNRPLYHEECAVRNVGGELAFTDDVHYASTELLKRYCKLYH